MVRRAFVNNFASKNHNRRTKDTGKGGDVVTDHSDIHSGAHATIGQEQNIWAFSRCLSAMAKSTDTKAPRAKCERKRDRITLTKKTC